MKGWLKGIGVLGLAAVLAAVVVVAPGEASAAQKGVLVISGTTAVNNLDPASQGASTFTMIYRNLFMGLLRYKFNSAEIEGDLAKSWTVSKDGLTYTFKLRDDVQWHKGFGKVTAQDVKFSFDRIKDPNTRSLFMGDLRNVKEVKVIDDTTVEISLIDRNVAFLYNLVRPRPAAIVCKKAVEQYGADFSRNPIGSGPYVFESISREEVVMTANKNYYEGPPKIDKVIYRAIPDIDTQVMSLIKGEIDVIWNFSSDKAYFDRVRAAGLSAKGLNFGSAYLLLMNPAAGPLGDVRVRRAIAYAINKDEIIKNLFVPGLASRLDSHIPKGYWGHTEEGIPRYNYDPQKAKALLAEAGFPNGFDITLSSPNLDIYVAPSTAIQSQLANVGIRVKLDVSDETAWAKILSGATGQMTLFLPVRFPDADSVLTSFYHTAGFSPGQNFGKYNKLDKEIEEARKEMDQTKRLKMYQEIQRRLMEDLPTIPLFNYNFAFAYRPNVVGLADRDPIWGVDFYRLSFKD